MPSSESPNPAQVYEQFYGPTIFGPLAEAFIAFAPPPLGGSVLDLACGTGVCTRVLARRVGPRGRVLGVDINPAMLEVARDHPPDDGAPISWEQADASSASFAPRSLDAAYCQQGLQFFPDREAALRSVHTALKPGAFFAVAAWQDIGRQALFAAFAEVEARYLADLGVTYQDLIAPFALGEPGSLQTLLEASGFGRVRVSEHPLEIVVTDPATFARRMETGYGAVIPAFVADRAAFEQFVAAVERETRDIVARFTVNGVLRFMMPTYLASGSRA